MTLTKRNIVLAVILSFVTCGIYGFYWCYKMGALLDEAAARRGMPTQSRGVLYLILGLIGLGIVDWVLMQLTINEMIDRTAF